MVGDGVDHLPSIALVFVSAAFGFLNPLLAAFIHVSPEIAFILNSANFPPPGSSANQFVRGILSPSSSATS
jgi:hypothetical protein